MEQGAVTRQVAERIRELRTLRRMSTTTLAKQMNDAGITSWRRATVSKIELGSRKSVTIDELEALSTIFQVPIASFLSASCSTCYNNVPTGFTCNTCGVSGG
jgi:transcriptional regulator with XRE-family HTH domain